VMTKEKDVFAHQNHREHFQQWLLCCHTYRRMPICFFNTFKLLPL
jgi:hypothetical protein